MWSAKIIENFSNKIEIIDYDKNINYEINLLGKILDLTCLSSGEIIVNYFTEKLNPKIDNNDYYGFEIIKIPPLSLDGALEQKNVFLVKVLSNQGASYQDIELNSKNSDPGSDQDKINALVYSQKLKDLRIKILITPSPKTSIFSKSNEAELKKLELDFIEMLIENLDYLVNEEEFFGCFEIDERLKKSDANKIFNELCLVSSSFYTQFLKNNHTKNIIEMPTVEIKILANDDKTSSYIQPGKYQHSMN